MSMRGQCSGGLIGQKEFLSGLPAMPDVVNNQGAGEQLDLVTEDFASGAAGQNERIEKDALAERQFERRHLAVLEMNRLGQRIG